MTVSESADAPESRFLHGWAAAVLIVASLVGAAVLYGVLDLASGGYLSQPHEQRRYVVISLALILGAYPLLRSTRPTLMDLSIGVGDWGGLIRAAALDSVAFTMYFTAFTFRLGL